MQSKTYKMLNQYFKRPIFWDYTIATILSGFVYLLYIKKTISLPKTDYILQTTSDLTTIALTLAGFVLTILTVLITFKSGVQITKKTYNENDRLFDLFFVSDLYFESIKHLKNGVKSLIFISMLGYTLKLLLSDWFKMYLYFFNIIGLFIIVATLYKSLLILSKIINLQKDAVEE